MLFTYVSISLSNAGFPTKCPWMFHSNVSYIFTTVGGHDYCLSGNLHDEAIVYEFICYGVENHLHF